jgi:hypothetical protein
MSSDDPVDGRRNATYHEKSLAKCSGTFSENFVWVERNDVAEREDERMNVFHVEIVGCDGI